MRSIWNLAERVSGLLVVLCSLALAGCGPSKSAPLTPLILQPAQFASPRWESISLPIPGTQLLSYTVSPTDPETIYACTGNPGEDKPGLWRTLDAGKHWSLLPLPAASGNGCTISIAPSQPRRIAFEVTSTNDNQRPCDRDVLYLSTDGGATWKRIPHDSIAPQGADNAFCSITVMGRHLYLWYTFGGGQSSPQQNLLERSDNNGKTWVRTGTDFGPGVMFFPPQDGGNDTLATIVLHSPPTHGAKSVLWMSQDAGRSWQQTAALPTPVGTYLLTSSPQGSSWPTPAAPFYALANEQIPSSLYDLRVFQSPDGRQWFAIPPLPVPGASGEHPGLLQALAATNDGHLLAFGVNPRTGLPEPAVVAQKPTAAFWLWLWNPRTSHWQVLSSPLTHPASESCGLCWSSSLSSGPNHTTYLYVYHGGDSYVYHEGDSDNLFRVPLPVD